MCTACLVSLISVFYGCPWLRDDDENENDDVVTSVRALMMVFLLGWLFGGLAGLLHQCWTKL